MANAGFNGTTITIAGAAETPLLSCTYDDSAAEVNITGCGDAIHTYEAGIPNPTITCEVVGANDAAVADEGALSIAWFDGTTDTIASVVITAVSRTGSLDSPLTTSITARPS